MFVKINQNSRYDVNFVNLLVILIKIVVDEIIMIIIIIIIMIKQTVSRRNLRILNSLL